MLVFVHTPEACNVNHTTQGAIVPQPLPYLIIVLSTVPGKPRCALNMGCLNHLTGQNNPQCSLGHCPVPDCSSIPALLSTV